MTSMVRKNASRVGASVLSSRRAKKRSCTSRPRAMTGCAFSVHSSWVLRRSPDIPGSGAVRVVCQKHQDVKGGLGQLEFLTQRLAHGAVRLRGLEADLYGRVHAALLFVFLWIVHF